MFKNIKNFIKKLVHFGPHPHYVKLLANPWFSYFGCLELSTQHVSIKSYYQCLWESNQREMRVLWSNMNFALTSSQVNLFLCEKYTWPTIKKKEKELHMAQLTSKITCPMSSEYRYILEDLSSICNLKSIYIVLAINNLICTRPNP